MMRWQLCRNLMQIKKLYRHLKKHMILHKKDMTLIFCQPMTLLTARIMYRQQRYRPFIPSMIMYSRSSCWSFIRGKDSNYKWKMENGKWKMEDGRWKMEKAG